MEGGLLALIDELTSDPSAQADLAADPDGFLVARGLEGFTATDLQDALDHAADALPVDVAAHLTGDLPDFRGLDDHDAVLRMLDHATDAPIIEEGDMANHLAFGEGSPEDAQQADAEEVDVEVEPDDLDADADTDAVDEVEDALVGQDEEAELELELEQPEPEPVEEDGVESEELPTHWGDGHTDEGGVDPHDLGGDLGHFG